jgi:hypothetical protein
MSDISKIIGKYYYAFKTLSDVSDAVPHKTLLTKHSKGLSSVLDGMRAANMTEEWATKVRKEHGERIAARNTENGVKDNDQG